MSFSKNNCKYFIYNEVVLHNTPNDFWIVIHGNVLDLTRFIQDRLKSNSWNDNMEYLTTFGGKDLSKYFHETGLPKVIVSGVTGKQRFLFCPIIETASTESERTPGHYWSTDPLYQKGKLTKIERRIRIINTLNGVSNYLTVCEEDTIQDIKVKYKNFYNSHADSYIWRKSKLKGAVNGALNLYKTVTENGIFYTSRDKEYPPSLWLFYNNDLTIA